jgi:hypothetical protein
MTSEWSYDVERLLVIVANVYYTKPYGVLIKKLFVKNLLFTGDVWRNYHAMPAAVQPYK